jgi:hypothetical protein
MSFSFFSHFWRIPAPDSVISPLPVIDGVTIPLSSWEAFSSGNVVDVPSKNILRIF